MTNLPTECQCSGPGHCPLLRRIHDPVEGRPMSEVRHAECKSKPHYFEMFIAESVAGGNTTARGLGDSVANGLERIGIKKWRGCRCSRVQKWLNRLFPYGTE